MKEKLEKITYFRPAYDKRHTDPKKDYGIGNVTCLMILKGKKGAVHFSFSTGMLLTETMEEYIRDGRAKYELTSYGHYYLNKPMGYDVGYHALKPQFKGQESRGKCEWLDNKPCYCDGSALASDEYLDVLLKKGSPEIWTMLEADYKERFKK